MNNKIKFALVFILATCYLLLTTNSAHAEILKINNQGQIIWEVLGDSTIQVAKIAQIITPSPNSEISLTNSDGKINLSVKDGSQTQNMDVTNLKDNLIEVESRGDTNKLKIGSENNKFSIQEEDIKALTNFPITIDPAKNQLSVKTNSGDRLVSILPFEATLSLTRGKFIDKINSNTIELTEGTNGELQYTIDGSREINLFNISKLTIPVKSNVSASNGTILKVDEPSWLRILGFLFT